MTVNKIHTDASDRMEKALEALKKEFEANGAQVEIK